MSDNKYFDDSEFNSTIINCVGVPRNVRRNPVRYIGKNPKFPFTRQI